MVLKWTGRSTLEVTIEFFVHFCIISSSSIYYCSTANIIRLLLCLFAAAYDTILGGEGASEGACVGAVALTGRRKKPALLLMDVVVVLLVSLLQQMCLTCLRSGQWLRLKITTACECDALMIMKNTLL